MAKYLRPRRGTQSNAAAQNIVLKSGEMFMEIPSGTMGKTPGRIILGDGSTAYSSLNYATTSSTAYQPFITDPMLYTPIFNNSTYATSNWSVNSATSAIDKIGNGSGQVTLPTIIGGIKEALCKHEDSITSLNNDLDNKFTIKTIRVGGAGYTDTFSGQALYNSMKNDQNVPYRCFFFFVNKQFIGGDRFGFAYLYEDNKDNGSMQVFHYFEKPKFYNISSGTVTMMDWWKAA